MDPKGYCDDSAYHFEICGGQIVKSVANYQRDRKGTGRDVPEPCKNCKYGFYKPYKWDENLPLAQLLKKHMPQKYEDLLQSENSDSLQES